MNTQTQRRDFLIRISLALLMTLGGLTAPAIASGGSGSGGGGLIQSSNLSGNWSGSITTSFGKGAFTMAISQSQTTLSGSVHFGAPIFDATRKLAGSLRTTSGFSGSVSNGQGSLPLTGTLSADGKTITGTVTQGQVYTYVVVRK